MPSSSSSSKDISIGVGLAMLAALIWSGNFIVARGVIRDIQPVSLAFYRWLIATIIIIPFALKRCWAERAIIRQSFFYLLCVSLMGVTLFNTLVYIGAHDSTAINLALIGTTSSPVIAIILAAIFLKETISAWKLAGLLICITGVFYLLSHGKFHDLIYLKFSAGDGWVLLAGFSFAIYTTLVRRKPAGLSSMSFLLITFSIGTLLLMPAYLWENDHAAAIQWDSRLFFSVLYLGVGASVIAFLCWNLAIGKLGAGRTALFSNLIPIFSSVEAVIILDERFTWTHVISMWLVFTGIILANRAK
jgi:drug/metabolite transporter (DMT)-like permease